MAIKIVVSDIVGFKVKGTINDEAGVAQPFTFGLTCTRLDQEQISEKLRTETPIVEFLVGIVLGWSDVKDDADKPLPFSEESLRALFKIPGVSGVAFRTYLAEVGAKEKN